MQFLSPGYLYLALLGVIPVLLYFFRRRSRTFQVSTLVFFKSLAREHQESAWLRRLKKLLSLLLALAILLGAVAALGRLIMAPRSEGLRSVVLVLDRSASMGALDEDGRTRLDTARNAIAARLAGLGEDVGVSLLIYDSRTEVALSRGFKRRELLSVLDRVEIRPVRDDEEGALSMAVMIAGLETPAEIWHFTDRVGGGDGPREAVGEAGAGEPVGEAARELPEGVRLRRFPVALDDGPNVGITAFQIRRVPLVNAGYEAYIQVSASRAMGSAVEAEMEVTLGGVPVQIRQLELEPGDREGIILPLEGVVGQRLQITLRAERDCFSADDTVLVELPEARPVVAAWITQQPDPFTELALSSIVSEGELELWQGDPASWPISEAIDLVIFDGWLPETWPSDLPVIVINPPGSRGPVRAVAIAGGGIARDSVRVANPEHPVLFRVSSGRVALTQTSVIDSSGSLEPLWFAGREPVLVAGEVRGQRLVVMGFSPQQSESLPLMASYPLLIGNAVFWCAESGAIDRGTGTRRTGDVVEVAGGEMLWEQVRDGRILTSRVTIEGPLVELDRIGLWQAGEDRGSALLLSRRETDLAGVLPGSDDTAPGEASADEPTGLLRGEMTRIFLWVIVFLLVLESWLFHRHAVY
ncbi:MAG: BatA and WFA domain-containing protein [Verrucomicrobiales bacterium]